MISISDLKAKRAAMTPGPYGTFEVDPDGPCGELLINAPTRDVAIMPDDEMADENATGIVATHNAADVLIEIAEAALAYEQAKIDAAVIRYTYATADDRRTGVGAQRIEAHDRDEIRCRAEYRAALAKVRP